MSSFLVNKAELLRELQGDVGKNTEWLENGGPCPVLALSYLSGLNASHLGFSSPVYKI